MEKKISNGQDRFVLQPFLINGKNENEMSSAKNDLKQNENFKVDDNIRLRILNIGASTFFVNRM